MVRGDDLWISFHQYADLPPSQAGVVVAGVCIAVNHALDERRRQREEDREFEAAIAASLYEFEQDSQRRQTQVDREQRAIASAVARSAESEGNEGTLRRRRRTSDFASRSTVRVTPKSWNGPHPSIFPARPC